MTLFYMILYILTDLGLWYVWSALIASVPAVGVKFLLHKSWAFKNKNTKDVPKQLALYVGIIGGMFVVNAGALYIVVEYAHLSHLVAQAVISPPLSVASFVLVRKIFIK